MNAKGKDFEKMINFSSFTDDISIASFENQVRLVELTSKNLFMYSKE